MTYLSPTEAKLRAMPDDEVMALSEDSILGPLYSRWFEADQKAQNLAQTLADTEQAVKDTQQKITDAEALVARWWPKLSAHENWLRTVHPERFTD